MCFVLLPGVRSPPQKACVAFLRADPERIHEMSESDGYGKLSKEQFQELLPALSSSGRKRKRDEQSGRL